MFPQAIDSLRPATSPRALPVGAGEDGDTGPSARLVHPWVPAQPPWVGSEGLAEARSVHPGKPPASWPRFREPWKRATGKKIKQVWLRRSSGGKGDLTADYYWQGPDADGSRPFRRAAKRGAARRPKSALCPAPSSSPSPALPQPWPGPGGRMFRKKSNAMAQSSCWRSPDAPGSRFPEGSAKTLLFYF